MCECHKEKLIHPERNALPQRQNIIDINCNCWTNQSSICNFDDELLITKSLIHWNPCNKKVVLSFTNCNDILTKNKLQLSSDYSISESSTTDEFGKEQNFSQRFDVNQEKYVITKSDGSSNHDHENSEISKSRWKVVPKNYIQTSEIHKKNAADIEYTLAIINPDIINYRILIEQIIISAGFEICQKNIVHMTPEQTSEFFIEKYGEICFPHLISYMSSGPIITLVLAKHQAINDWLSLIGPEEITKAKSYFPDSIRAKFGNDQRFHNAVHGSCSNTAAKREIHFFFPDFIIEPILSCEQVDKYLWNTINPILNNGMVLCCRIKPKNPLIWLANWLLKNNPNNPYNCQ